MASRWIPAGDNGYPDGLPVVPEARDLPVHVQDEAHQRGAVHDRCRPGNRNGPTCTTGVDLESDGTHNREESSGLDHKIEWNS